ncbi:uncharacterized protein H6S33_006869 [Morchella sextelata]|uniref:uncharacterized protein n=1 Tax=Morchella sextelata TaxID=1174677 RepID=UPI001D038C55|nr:uncharacterized protein H6S33_006869 [Morchella sextelata]KAH0604492.1 hypothetical protein H6S33_006869 [Morchella sextelata]
MSSTPCPLCPRYYRRAGHLARHIYRHHGGDDAPEDERLEDETTLPDAGPGTLTLVIDGSDDSTDSEADSEAESDFDPDSDDDGPAAIAPPISEQADDNQRATAYLPNSGQRLGRVQGYRDYMEENWKPWAPFKDAAEWRLARFFIEHKLTSTSIDAYFNEGLHKTTKNERSFQSAYTFQNQLDKMTGSPPNFQYGTVGDGFGRTTDLYYRNPVECARYLLGQRCYKSSMVYRPERVYDADGYQLYSEMHTADWWWNMQERLPTGATIVPIICSSDVTHLTNFSGDKKTWPIYMTIGNIPGKVRSKPSTKAHLLLALLPIPPKIIGDATSKGRLRSWAAETLRRVMSVILEPLLHFDQRLGVLMGCSDGYERRCWPILTAWLSDHMESCNILNTKFNLCPKCEIPVNRLGEYEAEPLKTYPRDQDEYKRMYRQYRALKVLENPTRDERRELKTLTKWFDSRGLRPLYNPFWNLPFVQAYDLHKQDMLHVVYLGILKHLMEWLEDFLKEHGRLDEFNAIWTRMPPYPGFTPPTKPYQAVSQWQGKEMRNFQKIILPALASALRNPSSAQAEPFKKAFQCVRALVDWALVAQHRSHNELTIDMLDNYLKAFHRTKDIFRKYRATRETDRLVAERRRELRGEYDVELAGLNDSLGQRRRVIADQRLNLQAETDEILRAESHFNFPKIHLMGHFAEHIRQYGNIPDYSTESCESAHRDQIKIPYRRSNRVDPAMQILRTFNRDYTFSICELNLLQIARDGFSTTELVGNLDVLEPRLRRRMQAARRDLRDPQDDPAFQAQDIAPLVYLPSDTRVEKRWVKCPVKLTNVGSVDIAGATKRLGYYIRRYFRRELCLGYEDMPEDIDSWRVNTFKQLNVPVLLHGEGDERTIHTLRTTGTSGYRRGNARNDWVWFRQKLADLDALQGLCPARLLAVFKLRDPRRRGARLLAAIQPLKPDFNGNPNVDHGLIRVSRCSSSPDDIWVVNIKSILDAAHLVPETTSSTNNRWFINSTIDLSTY